MAIVSSFVPCEARKFRGAPPLLAPFPRAFFNLNVLKHFGPLCVFLAFFSKKNANITLWTNASAWRKEGLEHRNAGRKHHHRRGLLRPRTTQHQCLISHRPSVHAHCSGVLTNQYLRSLVVHLCCIRICARSPSEFVGRSHRNNGRVCTGRTFSQHLVYRTRHI